MGVLVAESELPAHPFANQELLHLTSNGHRERIYEHNVSGNLVVRNLTGAEIAHLLRRRLSPFLQPNAGAYFLTKLGAWNTHHCDIEYRRMGVQEFFNLAW